MEKNSAKESANKSQRMTTRDDLSGLYNRVYLIERVREEIVLQTSLARALQMIKGFTAEVEQAYARALELCDGAGEIPELFPVLRGLSTFYLFRAEFEKSVQLAERILRLAERLDDADMAMEGHMVLGYDLAGFNLQTGLDHLEQAIAAYDPSRHGGRRRGFGANAGVICLTASALYQWMAGLPDRARKRAGEAVGLALKLDHPFSKCYALFHYGLLFTHCQDHEGRDDRRDRHPHQWPLGMRPGTRPRLVVWSLVCAA